jgi:DnaD/phage-associated family protein
VTAAGFPARARSTAIPDVFFTDVLPQLAGDAASLGVILYAIHLLIRKRGSPRFIEEAELRAHAPAQAFLGDGGAASIGLARGVELGVLLSLDVERDGEAGVGRRTLYFLNTPADRRGREAVRNGAVDVGVAPLPDRTTARPAGIVALYESVVGAVSPLIADELAEAERLYPAEWLEAAFREAAAQNARSWRYVARILERWADEGPNYATAERDPAAGERYFAGKYGRVLKQRVRR